MNQLAGSLTDAVVTYTRDYGEHSPYLSRYIDNKLRVISPPVDMGLPIGPAPDRSFGEEA
jgi:hypothetical protein